MMGLEKSFIKLQNNWFDVEIAGNTIEIYSRHFLKQDQNNRTPTISIDLEQGLCNVLNMLNDQMFSGEAHTYINWDMKKVSYNFSLVLRNEDSQ